MNKASKITLLAVSALLILGGIAAAVFAIATESKKELEDSVAKKLKDIKTDYKLQLRSLTNKFDAMLK